MGKEYHVAVVGATGAVGTKMIELLAETSLPIASVSVLLDKRFSLKGNLLSWKN